MDSSSSAAGDADTDTDCYKCMRGSDQCHKASHVAECDSITLLLHGVRGLWHLQNLPLYPHFVIYLIRPLNADWSQQRRSCFKAQWVNHTCQTFYNVCCTILGEVLVAQVHANAKFLLLFLLGYKTKIRQDSPLLLQTGIASCHNMRPLVALSSYIDMC